MRGSNYIKRENIESLQAFEYQTLSITAGEKSSELEEGKYKGRC